MGGEKYSSSGVVVGRTPGDRNKQKMEQQRGNKVTMGHGAPQAGQGAVGDITVREISAVGLRAFIKTNSGWQDINNLRSGVQVTWHDMILKNSWARHTTAYEIPGYFKDVNGKVHLKGAVSSGTATDAVITTMPEGYRPAYAEYLGCVSSGSGDCAGSFGLLKVATNGEITCEENSTTSGGIIFGNVSYISAQVAGSSESASQGSGHGGTQQHGYQPH